MYLRKIILIATCFICSCSDYSAGYKDGYGNLEKEQWVVFGRTEYLNGFEAGKAENFQQDWLAENLSDINQLQCPVVTIRDDPLMFLPTNYKRVGSDTYKTDFH